MGKKKVPTKDKPRIGRPPTGQMPPHQYRLESDIYAECKAKAANQGKTLSEVIREYLLWWLAQ